MPHLHTPIALNCSEQRNVSTTGGPSTATLIIPYSTPPTCPSCSDSHSQCAETYWYVPQEDHTQDYCDAAVDTALQIHCHQPPGGLPFLAMLVHDYRVLICDYGHLVRMLSLLTHGMPPLSWAARPIRTVHHTTAACIANCNSPQCVCFFITPPGAVLRCTQCCVAVGPCARPYPCDKPPSHTTQTTHTSHSTTRASAGDILVFLTGQAEIDKAISKLNEAIASLPEGSCGPLLLLPLYASLPPEMQVRACVRVCVCVRGRECVCGCKKCVCV